MKLRFLSLSVFLAAAGAVSLQAQIPAAIKATTKIRPDGSTASIVVDSDARTAEETITSSNDKVMQKTKFVLDDRNLAVEATHYDAKGNVRYKERMKRDSADHIVESAFFSAAGQPLGRRVFYYSGDKVTGMEDYDAKGALIVAPAPVKAARPDKKRR